jgi:hypothetical protein
MQSTQLDQDRLKIFARELLKLYTGSVLTRLIALGHDLGLFNVLAQGAATSDELATRAHLQERYVREWLGAMATGGFVTYDVETKSYVLPAEHALLLAGDTGRNMAPFAGLLEALGSHMAELEDCFRVGGGIPYSSFRPRSGRRRAPPLQPRPRESDPQQRHRGARAATSSWLPRPISTTSATQWRC